MVHPDDRGRPEVPHFAYLKRLTAALAGTG